MPVVVVVEEVIERQEQADEILEDGNAERYLGTGWVSRFGISRRLTAVVEAAGRLVMNEGVTVFTFVVVLYGDQYNAFFPLSQGRLLCK